MTQLICQVQSLYLGNEERTLIKEGERFEVDEKIAEQYTRGGIAKLVEVPAEKQTPAPAQATPTAKPDPTTSSLEQAEEAKNLTKKKR